MPTTRLLLLAGFVLLASCRTAPPGSPVLYEGARLITGGEVVEDSAFLVEDGEFKAVGKRGEIDAAASVRVNLGGKTVIPALVDAHAHLGWTLLRENRTATDTYSKENLTDHLRRYAYYGIAAVRNLGIDPGEAAYELRANPVPGAALLLTAGRGIAMPNAGPGQVYWRPVAYGVTTEAEARAAVRELAAKKVDAVKMWVDDRMGTVQKLTPELRRVIIDEAHKNGLKAVAHIFYREDAKDLLRAGIDGFAHGVRDVDIDEEFLSLIKARPEVWVIPNLPDRGTSTADLVLAAQTLPHSQVERLSRPTTPNLELYNVQARNLAKLAAAGVKIAYGTDAGVAVGWTAHQELADMVRAGMTPAQVLRAATQVSAEITGLTKLGGVAPGKSASFVVLDANPLEDIVNTREIGQVYLQGVPVDRASLAAEFTRP